MRKTIRVTAVLLGLLLCAASPAAANSAMQYWTGADGTGAVAQTENCPLTVEHETLTFVLQDFPESYAQNPDYAGRVTASYTFHNPSAEDVTARLDFPLGTTPNYAAPANEEHCQITVDGAAVEVTERYTYHRRGEDFVVEQSLPRLRDGYTEHTLYRPDTPVTRYVYEVASLPEEGSMHAALVIGNDPDRRAFLADANGYSSENGGTVQKYFEEGMTAFLYVIGEPYETMPEWSYYTNGGLAEAAEGGELRLVSETAMTFEELAMADWFEASGIPATDWYNAFVDMLDQQTEGSVLMELPFDEDREWPTLVSWDLMRWYEYEMTVPAGGSVQNEVTALMYPAIDEEFDPAVYEYTYLLSPAATWADFGDLDIRIETAGYLLEGSSAAFEQSSSLTKADTRVYEAHLDGLPEGELTFNLCTDPSPKREFNGGTYILFGVLGLLLVLVLLVVVAVILIVRAVLRRRRS